jgi:hypothetical protein
LQSQAELTAESHVCATKQLADADGRRVSGLRRGFARRSNLSHDCFLSCWQYDR